MLQPTLLPCLFRDPGTHPACHGPSSEIPAPILLATVPTVHSQCCLRPCFTAPAPGVGMLSARLDEQRLARRNAVTQHCSSGSGDLKKQRKLQIEGTNRKLLQKAWGVSWFAAGWQLSPVSAELSSEHLLSQKAALGISSAQFPTRSLLKCQLHGATLMR